ncbi:hypothetical protein HZA56_03020, partial [Candidatus Poribacteria bacterium]|nr:hypothetical protein [Candidatus Poribacteria bacterium]
VQGDSTSGQAAVLHRTRSASACTEAREEKEVQTRSGSSLAAWASRCGAEDINNINTPKLWICGKLYEFPTYPQLLLLLLIMLTLMQHKEEKEKEKKEKRTFLMGQTRGHFNPALTARRKSKGKKGQEEREKEDREGKREELECANLRAQFMVFARDY